MNGNPISGYELARSVFRECGERHVDALVEFSGGETDWLEFKAGLFSRPEDLEEGENQEDALWHVAKAVFEFFNSHGGLIVVGIEDDPKHGAADLKESPHGDILSDKGMETYLREVVMPNLPPTKKNWNTGLQGRWWLTEKDAANMKDAVVLRKASYKNRDVVLVFVKPPEDEKTVAIVRDGKRQRLHVRVPGDIGKNDPLDDDQEKLNWIHKRRRIKTNEFAGRFEAFLRFKAEEIRKKRLPAESPEKSVPTRYDRLVQAFRDSLDPGPAGVFPLLDRLKDGPMPNVDSPTLGGRLWWDEIVSKNDWKLQRHKLFKQFRILDDKDFRRAWGWRRGMERMFGIGNGIHRRPTANRFRAAVAKRKRALSWIVGGAVACFALFAAVSFSSKTPPRTPILIDRAAWKNYCKEADASYGRYVRDIQSLEKNVASGLKKTGADAFADTKAKLDKIGETLSVDVARQLVEAAAKDRKEKNDDNRRLLSAVEKNLVTKSFRFSCQAASKRVVDEGKKTFETPCKTRLALFLAGLPPLRKSFPEAVSERMGEVETVSVSWPSTSFPETVFPSEQDRIERMPEDIVRVVLKQGKKEIDIEASLIAVHVRTIDWKNLQKKLAAGVRKELLSAVEQIRKDTIDNSAAAAERMGKAYLEAGNRLYKTATEPPPEVGR